MPSFGDSMLSHSNVSILHRLSNLNLYYLLNRKIIKIIAILHFVQHNYVDVKFLNEIIYPYIVHCRQIFIIYCITFSSVSKTTSQVDMIANCTISNVCMFYWIQLFQIMFSSLVLSKKYYKTLSYVNLVTWWISHKIEAQQFGLSSHMTLATM